MLSNVPRIFVGNAVVGRDVNENAIICVDVIAFRILSGNPCFRGLVCRGQFISRFYYYYFCDEKQQQCSGKKWKIALSTSKPITNDLAVPS